MIAAHDRQYGPNFRRSGSAKTPRLSDLDTLPPFRAEAARESGGPDWAMGTIGANPDGSVIARPRGTGVGIWASIASLFFE
jgi:hypothetical protein